jgi:hypothetical protein
VANKPHPAQLKPLLNPGVPHGVPWTGPLVCEAKSIHCQSAEGTNVAPGPWAGGCYWRLFAPEAEFSGLPRLLSDSPDDAERGSIVNTITNV